MVPAGLVAALAFTAVPPLTEGQQARLAAAVDGVSHREDAFEALLEHVRRWTSGLGAAPVRLERDLGAMLENPAAFRGGLHLLSGVLQQATPLEGEFTGVAEWVIRNDAGRPILVYVVGSPAGGSFREGVPVEVPARFYKRIDDWANDGRMHRYPAFVGAFPEAVAPPRGAWSQLWVVAVPVAVMFVVFLALFVHALRGRRPRARPLRGLPAPGAWAGPPADGLPDDPAEALAELRRRAEASDA